MRRCVIVGGADISRYDRIRPMLQPEDYFIYCDSGLRHQQALGRRPDLIVGDFDSHENPHMDVETIVLPCEKDDTDTVFAVKEAIRRGWSDFLLLGVIGGRLDHTLGNVGILLFLDAQGMHGRILDDFSDMEIVSRQPVTISDDYAYFSLLNVSGLARGVTIEHAKYPLTEGEITCEYQYGVSNEVLPGRTARVSVREGRLLLIRDF
ncbi:MAG: thiamine diphosphokinase [Aristaeellaceae bacterium]